MLPTVNGNLNVHVESWSVILSHHKESSCFLESKLTSANYLSLKLACVLSELQTSSHGGWLTKQKEIVWDMPLALSDLKLVANLFLDLLFPTPPFIFQHGKTSVMAGDAIMVMRGLTKVSKAIIETQAGQLRQVLLGGDAVTVARTLQAAAEEQFSSALGKMQVSKALCA